MQTTIKFIIYVTPPAPSPAPAPVPMPSIQLDLIINTAHITRLFSILQRTATIEVVVINRGTVATDVTFEYELLNDQNQIVFKGTRTEFISGLDRRTVYIEIPIPPDGKYTVKVRTVDPVRVEAKTAGLTVETPIYGGLEFMITILLIVVLAIYIIKRR
jgi:uncharacterized membrane protein